MEIETAPATSSITLPSSSSSTIPYTLKRDQFSSHYKISMLIKNRAHRSEDARYPVLDLGCAPAFLRYYLALKDFYLMGVDIDEASIAIARQHYDVVYHADIAQTQKFVLPVQPRTLVFGDILEHLVDPAAVLQQILKNHATPGTQIVISLPNVAHIYVRLNLLLGRFEYQERGLLDRTHFRFFTLKSAQEMIESANIHIKSIQATPVPLPLISSLFDEKRPLFGVHWASHFLANHAKSLLAYQMIFDGEVR